MQWKKNNCGAFLLEALLAVFIMSVGLVGLIRGLHSSLNAAVEAERYAVAIQAADNALVEVVRLNGQKMTGPIELENEGEEIKAKIAVKKAENSQIPEILYQTQLTVSWPGKLKDKKIEATTLVFGSVDEEK